MSSAFPLFGLARHYGWGGERFIPSLLGQDNPRHAPFAEWWLGAHLDAPSVIMTAQGPQPLHYAIASEPEAFLGKRLAARYGGRLPFLLKVLDVAAPLSIQVHPDREQAQHGYRRENAAGLSPEDPARSYRDAWPKPEMMVALSSFWLLHGFRPMAELLLALRACPEWKELAAQAERMGLADFYAWWMRLPQSEVEDYLTPVVRRLAREAPEDQSTPAWWVHHVARQRPGDRGLLSFCLLNLVHLRPGEAIYQPARLPHAYLSGRNVELMANSDNVLRGGLTDKKIDIDALLDVIDFSAITPEKWHAGEDRGGLSAYPRRPEAGFALDQLLLADGERCSMETEGPEMWLVVDGTLQLHGEHTVLTLTQGQSVFLQPGFRLTWQAPHLALAYRAFSP